MIGDVNVKQWTKKIEINAPIDQVWSLLNGPLETIQKIMPQVVAHKPIKITEDGVGSVYLQKYKEGKRIEEYEVETLEYTNTPDHKKLKVGFTLAKMFEITAQYDLMKMETNRTAFTYTTTNQPLKWFMQLFLVFASEKVVVEFTEKVKSIAEGKV